MGSLHVSSGLAWFDEVGAKVESVGVDVAAVLVFVKTGSRLSVYGAGTAGKCTRRPAKKSIAVVSGWREMSVGNCLRVLIFA